ncbi:MAG: hypothetical protein ACFFD1_03030, partial [Candidatus Thorarchaeota archaeon]
MSTMKDEKYPIISKLIAVWFLLTGIFLFFEVLFSLLGFHIVESIHFDTGFETMLSSYAFSSFL